MRANTVRPYGVPIEHLWVNRSIPKVILSVFRTDGYKICTGRTIIIILEPYIFSFRQFFFIIHYHHPSHYVTNRQRKQVLCRNFVSAISPLRMQREKWALFLWLANALYPSLPRKRNTVKMHRHGSGSIANAFPDSLFLRFISCTGLFFYASIRFVSKKVGEDQK